MTIQHANIPDGKIHEPKGISTASSGTVYVSNGAGSGVWKKTDSTILSGLAGDGGSSNLRVLSNGASGFQFKTDNAYGVMEIVNNTNAFTVTAAVDTSLNSNTDYVLITGTGAPWAAGSVNLNTTFSTNQLIAPVTGVYRVEYWVNISQFPTATSKIAIKHRINGATFSTKHPMANATATTDARNLSGFGLVSLNANDYLQAYVASTGAGSLVFSDFHFSIQLVKAS
jgi:hypothetical protein